MAKCMEKLLNERNQFQVEQCRTLLMQSSLQIFFNYECCKKQTNFDPIHDILGVRLNKPYSLRVSMDIPIFNGSHADLLVIVSITFELLIIFFLAAFSCW